MPLDRRDVPQFADVMLVMAERDQIEIAFRRFAAHQRVEAVLRQHLIDRAQPVGALGVSRRRRMVETGRVGEKKRHAGSWRVDLRLSRSG